MRSHWRLGAVVLSNCWFGWGCIDQRTDWYRCYAFGPLLFDTYRETFYERARTIQQRMPRPLVPEVAGFLDRHTSVEAVPAHIPMASDRGDLGISGTFAHVDDPLRGTVLPPVPRLEDR